MQPDKAERDTQVRNLSAEQREQLMIQVAKRYYQLDMTMAELSQELGLTRWQTSRLIAEARETGLVRIEIVPRTPRLPSLESRLQKRFGLKEAVVVPASAGDDEVLVLDSVARAAGRYMASLGKLPAIGVSWGRTMMAVARNLPPFWNDGVDVVLLNGAMNIRLTGPQTNNVAEMFARSGQGTATLLPVPAIFGNPESRAVLEHDFTIASVLEQARKVPVICFGLGALTSDSVLVQSNYITIDDLHRLKAAGAVGDLLGRFIDAEGRIVDRELDARTIGVEVEACRNREQSIAVVSGLKKMPILKSCLKAGYANVAIVDQALAEALLESPA